MNTETRKISKWVIVFVFSQQKWRPVLWMTEVMASWIQLHWRIWLLVPLALDHLALAEDLKPTRWPLYPQKPLVLVWNAPTEDCRPRHNVHLQLDQFQIVASPNEGFTKQNLTMFYKDRLGLYPHFQDGVASQRWTTADRQPHAPPREDAGGDREVHSWRVCTRPGRDRLGGMASDLDTELGHQRHLQEAVAALSGPEKPRLDPNPDNQSSPAGVRDIQPYIHAGDVTSGQKLASKPALGLLPLSWLL